MKKMSLATFVCALALSSPSVFAAEEMTEETTKTTSQQLCEKYAEEDGILAEDLKDYVAECISNLGSELTEETATEEPEATSDDNKSE